MLMNPQETRSLTSPSTPQNKYQFQRMELSTVALLFALLDLPRAICNSWKFKTEHGIADCAQGILCVSPEEDHCGI